MINVVGCMHFSVLSINKRIYIRTSGLFKILTSYLLIINITQIYKKTSCHYKYQY